MTTALAIPDLLGTCPADLIQLDQLAQSTPDEARARADRIRAGLADYTRMRQDIADARARRDWISLGHDTWHAYVEAEYGEALRRLTRDDRREAVRDLRAQGMSTRQIASATGVDQKQVRRDLAQVRTGASPATVTGADGKQYPATRPSTTDTTGSPAGRDPNPTPGPFPAVATTGRPGEQSPHEGAVGGGEVTRDAGLAAAPRPDANSAAAGFPIVLVAQEHGDPVEAELREERPGNPDIVNVAYLHSRTAAWIKRSRIIGGEYERDPAKRIQAVAEVAPEYVRPTDALRPVHVSLTQREADLLTTYAADVLDDFADGDRDVLLSAIHKVSHALIAARRADRAEGSS